MSDIFGDDTVHVNDLNNVWPDFDPNVDVVRLNSIAVSPNSSGADAMDAIFAARVGYKVMAKQSFWDRFVNGIRSYNGLAVDREGVLTGSRPPIASVPNQLVLNARRGGININTVYKGLKKAVVDGIPGIYPYIGKSFNLLKRYRRNVRDEMKIISLFPGAEGKLLNAVEQIVQDYQRSLGPVANINKAMDFNLAKNKGMYEKAAAFLEENYPNWKKIVSNSH